MEINTFPYRLDERTRDTLSGIVQILINNGARLQSSGTPLTILFTDKDKMSGLPMDAQIQMTTTGLSLFYRMNNVAKSSQKSLAWLKSYNAFLGRSLKEHAIPVPERCYVTVEATYDGQLKYYFTYMMAYDDQSLAQNMPQGRLYATEALAMAYKPAKPAMQAEPAQQASQPEIASWL